MISLKIFWARYCASEYWADHPTVNWVSPNFILECSFSMLHFTFSCNSFVMSLDCNHILDRILKQCVAIATHKKMNGIATRSLIIQGSASAMHHLRNNHQNEGVFLLYASHMCIGRILGMYLQTYYNSKVHTYIGLESKIFSEE